MLRTILLVAFAAVVSAQELTLEMDASKWNVRLFELGSIQPEEAGCFGIIETPEGRALSVGPWLAGSFGARYEYAEPLRPREARITGVYRTERLYPFEAAVAVGYYKGSQRLEQRTTSLGPAPVWTIFDVPIRRLPPGTDRVVVAFGLAEKTHGRAFFRDLRVTPAPMQLTFPEQPAELTRPAPPQSLGAGEYVRIKQYERTWWLLAPDGRPFFSLGTDAPVTGNAPARMRELGFNSLSGWSNVSAWAAVNDAEKGEPLYAFRALETGTMPHAFERLTNAKGETPGTHAFPDPWDPAWEQALDARVKSIALHVKGKRWFAGWFADNEASHRDLHRYVYSKYAARRLAEFLRERYENMESLNAAWGTDHPSFEDLIAAKPDPALRSGAMFEDFYEFSRVLVRKYNETIIRTIRKHDPDHLILSNRFMRAGVNDWIDRLDLYADYDAIAVNLYPANLSAGLSENELQLLRIVHERTGKPILLSEWSVPALDSGLYNDPSKLDWSYDQAVDTQAQRAGQAARVVTDLYNLPFVIGSHWFTWHDFDSEVRRANRGLFRSAGEPWPDLQSALRQVQLSIAARERRNGLQRRTSTKEGAK